MFLITHFCNMTYMALHRILNEKKKKQKMENGYKTGLTDKLNSGWGSCLFSQYPISKFQLIFISGLGLLLIFLLRIENPF